MPFVIRGWNEFYEGWLANCLDEPLEDYRDEVWKMGWQMGEETGPGKMIALLEEIRKGNDGTAVPQPHVTVQEISENYYKEILGTKNEYKEALQQIKDIPNKYDGGDWDEIDEARDIASKTLGDK